MKQTKNSGLFSKKAITLGIGNFRGRNFGDDLMLAGYLQENINFQDDMEFQLLCQSETDGTAYLGKHRIVEVPWGFVSILKGIARAREFVQIGGTHLQFVTEAGRATQYRVLVGWLALAVLARLSGTKVRLEAIGVGPLQSGLSRWLANRMLRTASRITVRDSKSFAAVRSVGCPVGLVDDLAVAYVRTWASTREHDSSPSARSHKHYVLAAPAFNKCDATWWADALSLEMERTGCSTVVFFSSSGQSSGSDESVAKEVQSRLKTLRPEVHTEHVSFIGDVDNALILIDHARSVIAARYHVVYASMLLGRPILADIYHPKVRDAMNVQSLYR